MPRILALDYGTKRTGIAVTDNLQIIATALETVLTKDLLKYLQDYTAKETVEAFVVGLPIGLLGEDTNASAPTRAFGVQLKNTFPNTPIHWVDERFTSKIALQTLISAGSTKKYRREKGNIDRVSAVIILQSFMETFTPKTNL